MAFEDALEEVGGYGLFNQTLLTAVLVLATWHVALGYFGHLFTLLTPASQWCFENVSDFNVTAMPAGPCQVVSGPKGNATVLVDRGFACPSGWIYDENDLFVTVTMENNWLCGHSDQLYALHTCHWVGSVVGFLASGFLADRFGRKKTILGLIVVTITANLGCVLFPNHVPFAIFRFLAGAGTYTTCASCFILVMEYTVASKRTLVAFIWGISWTLMAAVYPWYARYLSSWRGLLITTASLDAILLFICWWAPESSSWLLSRGRKSEAVRLLKGIAKFNGKAVGEERLDKVLHQRSGRSDVCQASLEQEVQLGFWRSTLAIVETPRIRRNTLVILPVWCLITLCNYVGSLQLGRLNLDVYSAYSVTSAFDLPVNVFCILALDRLGRRWPNVAMMFVGGTVTIIMAVVQTESSLWTLVMAVIYMMCFEGAFNITFQVASELFPTAIRGRAVLLQRITGDLGSVLGTSVAATVEWNRYLPLLISGILSIVAAGLLLFLPETVGLPLPQTIADGENLAKDRGFCFCPCITREGLDDSPGQEEHSLSAFGGEGSCSAPRPVE